MKLLHVALSVLSFSTVTLASTPTQQSDSGQQAAFSEDRIQATHDLSAATTKLLHVVQNNDNFTSAIDEVKALKNANTNFLIAQEVGEASPQNLSDAFNVVSVSFTKTSVVVREALSRHRNHDVLYHFTKVRNAFLKLSALQYSGDDLDD